MVTPRTIIYATEAEGHIKVLSTKDSGIDPRDSLWEAFPEILDDCAPWDETYQHRLRAGDGVTEISSDDLTSWIREARSVAVSGYRLVLEDGPDLSDSRDDAKVPDEEKNRYVPGSEIDSVRLLGFQAFVLRMTGRAGGKGIVSEALSGSAGIVSKI
jgi:hypothetical protein